MLRSIYIDNYALIERLEVELQEGLSIITGETGAGKSILLGALGLLLGKRADTSVLKDAGRKCVVEGVFYIKGYGLESFFKTNELDYTDETIIRREILNSGKSRAFINDSPVNLDLLQDLSLSLVDIHSQYQNLSLNSEAYIRWIIDCYSGNTEQLEEYRKLYATFITAKKLLVQTKENYRNNKQNLDFLTHQYTELAAAKIVPGELHVLEEEAGILNHAGEIKTALEACHHLFSDEEHGILKQLRQVVDQITHIRQHFPKINELAPRAESMMIEIKDIAAELQIQFDKIDFDPERMNTVNLRLDLIHSLLYKHKAPTIEELIRIRDEMEKNLKQVELGDVEIEELEKQLNHAQKEVIQLAERMSVTRKSVFSSFEEKVQSILRSLGMKNARFSILHEMIELSESGTDRIQFLFSANNNIPVQPIAKVASGGELSRLMLTIKYLISKAAELPTIVLDEIDTGVSGEIADKVGRLIKDMAVNMQVINITHLPQVASKGDHHYLVYKEASGGTTKALIRKLDKKERLNEIARMLSGDSVTEAAIENAKVLLQN